MRPEELEPEVTERVPINISRDDRYFQDRYQGLPKDGYHKMFERMLSNGNIKILINTDFKEVIDIDYKEKKIYFLGKEFKGKLIYTGKIDEFFNYRYGELPYRSLKFEFETLNSEYFQKVGVINYPNDYEFTRITEFKRLTGQKSYHTTIAKEYPQEHNRNLPEKSIPYYPVPKKENIELYKKYGEKAKDFGNIIFIGRLGEYKYYNMDMVIERSLRIFEEAIL
jgi:UDP-galactopyranose mutase